MQRILNAAYSLDTGAVARIVGALMAERGVVDVWDRVCVPALSNLPERSDGFDVAVEHVLATGIGLGLDLVSAPRHADIRTNHVLLACAPREGHSLPLQALAAALFEDRIGTFPLGPQVPWSALHAALDRTVPTTAIVWSQSTGTADPSGLQALVDRHVDTRFAVAGPGWSVLPAGVVHLRTINAALTACRDGLGAPDAPGVQQSRPGTPPDVGVPDLDRITTAPR